MTDYLCETVQIKNYLKKYKYKKIKNYKIKKNDK